MSSMSSIVLATSASTLTSTHVLQHVFSLILEVDALSGVVGACEYLDNCSFSQLVAFDGVMHDKNYYYF
jgi:hypothetical protein